MKNLWKVRVAVIGAGRTTDLYFETKEEAWDYYYDTDNCDKPAHVRVTEAHAKEFLSDTNYALTF